MKVVEALNILSQYPGDAQLSEAGLRIHRVESGAVTGPSPLAGVDFASDEAAELAAELGLDAAAFKDGAGSGKAGAFTVADVRSTAESLTKPANGED